MSRAASVEETSVSDSDRDFELRGVNLAMLESIALCALRACSDESYWSIARVKNEVIGSHETLRDDYRYLKLCYCN